MTSTLTTCPISDAHSPIARDHRPPARSSKRAHQRNRALNLLEGFARLVRLLFLARFVNRAVAEIARNQSG